MLHSFFYSTPLYRCINICALLILGLIPMAISTPGALNLRDTTTIEPFMSIFPCLPGMYPACTPTYTLTGCVPTQDPDANAKSTSNFCQCDNWSSPIPTRTEYSSIGGCTPTMTLIDTPTAIASASSDKPSKTTERVTLSNEAVNEYWGTMPTSQNFYGPGIPVTTMIRTSTSSLYSGKMMSIIQPSSTSSNVGNFTGMPLYTAVSDALMSACTAPGGGKEAPARTCGPNPTISNIIWTDDGGDWMDTEELALEIGPLSYTDAESLHAMVASIASALNSSSTDPHNSWKPERPKDTGYGFWKGNQLPNGEKAPERITNIMGWVQAVYTQDTAESHDWPEQNLMVNLVNKNVPKGTFLCADGALMTDAIAALALVPGLDFLAWMAAPALAVSATCDGIEHGAEKEKNEGASILYESCYPYFGTAFTVD